MRPKAKGNIHERREQTLWKKRRAIIEIVRKPCRQWLRRHETKIVSVLSCSMSREAMLTKALAFWKRIGAKVLLFVPEDVANDFEKTHGCGAVKIVSYHVHTTRMFVGHSRNAVLTFLKQHADIFKTCVMADERVYNLVNVGKTFGVQVSNPEDRFWYLKRFLSGATPSRRGVVAKEMRATFEYIAKDDVGLLSITDQARNRNRHYKDVVSRKPIIAQLVLFKVGPNGWHGQFYYPETTMGEDIAFAHQWSRENVGAVVELRSIACLRLCKGHPTLTRKQQDLRTYTNENLVSAVHLLMGQHIVIRDGKPQIQWIQGAELSPMVHAGQKYMYDEMYQMLKTIRKEWSRRTLGLFPTLAAKKLESFL